MALSPSQMADAVRSWFYSAPDGARPAILTVTSPSGEPKSLISSLSSYISDAAKKTAGILTPGNILVPGGAKAAQSFAGAAKSAGQVASAAGDGIKQGFSRATLILTLIFGFIVYRFIKG